MILLTPVQSGKLLLSKGIFISAKMGEVMAKQAQYNQLSFNLPLIPVHIPYKELFKNNYGKNDHIQIDIGSWQKLNLPAMYNGENLCNKKVIIFPMHGLGDQLYLAITIRNLIQIYSHFEVTIVKSGIASAEQWYPYIYFEKLYKQTGPVVSINEMSQFDFFINAEFFVHVPEYKGTYPPKFYMDKFFHHKNIDLKQKRPVIGKFKKSSHIDSVFDLLYQKNKPIVFVNPTTTGRARNISIHSILEFAKIALQKYTLIVSTFNNPQLQLKLQSLNNNIITTDKLIKNINDLMYIIDKCDMVLTTDSGFTHIAESLNTPCATVFNVVTAKERVGHYCFAIDAMIEFEIPGVCKTPCYVHAIAENKECPGMSFINKQAGKRLFWDYPPCMENLKGEDLMSLLEMLYKKFFINES